MAGLGMWISEHRCPPGSSAQLRVRRLTPELSANENDVGRRLDSESNTVVLEHRRGADALAASHRMAFEDEARICADPITRSELHINVWTFSRIRSCSWCGKRLDAEPAPSATRPLSKRERENLSDGAPRTTDSCRLTHGVSGDYGADDRRPGEQRTQQLAGRTFFVELRIHGR